MSLLLAKIDRLNGVLRTDGTSAPNLLDLHPQVNKINFTIMTEGLVTAEVVFNCIREPPSRYVLNSSL